MADSIMAVESSSELFGVWSLDDEGDTTTSALSWMRTCLGRRIAIGLDRRRHDGRGAGMGWLEGGVVGDGGVEGVDGVDGVDVEPVQGSSPTAPCAP